MADEPEGDVSMGVDSASPFASDEARAWVAELLEENDPSYAKEAIAAVVRTPSDEALELSDCVRAIVASELIAAASDCPSKDMPDDLTNWLASHPQTFSKKLINASLRAVIRIREDSELADVWSELDNCDDWIDAMEDLESRLESA